MAIRALHSFVVHQGQLEADQRFEAYKQELEAHDIRFDDRIVVEGNYSPESGRAAVRTLLDERGLRIQAIAGSNDHMAFGALEALEAHDRRVPGDVALVGFDDIQEAQALVVPLTTVRQPFYDSGQKAVETLVGLLRGETPPARVVMPSELVLRWLERSPLPRAAGIRQLATRT